ncbi:MFS transporter [uncultured Roseobacter sp.]|uniref:MFS transporter n=1 Tax=uncultured Roseobacter sp. TaxID=114847 RepID=UPI00260A14CB|nr:MFS transporter [uncultured Roseobacter sp.]
MTLKPQNKTAALIIGLSFVALALTFSARAALGLVMPILEQELGWSRSFTSGAAAGALLVMAAIAPFGGRLVDKQGARAILLIGLGALAAGCFLVAATVNPIAFLLAFSGIAAVGFGLVATHVVSTAVEQEVKTDRGLATGIATSGSTGGQFIFVPLLAVLISAYDWRLAFVALGIGTLVVMGCVFRWFPKTTKGTTDGSAANRSTGTLWRDLTSILKLPAFQILFWSYFICGYTTSGVIETHFLPYAAFCGFGPVPSATAYGLLSAINLVGMILAGWLTDRVNRPLLLGMIYLVRGLTFVILLNVGASFETLIFFSILFGLVDYSTVPVTASLVASHIGRGVMGLAFGLISAGHQIGAAAGAYFGGVLFDLYAQYDWVWWSSVWLAVCAGALVFLMKDKPQDRCLLQV